MIFPGAGGPELDKMASEKVKKDIGTFITFGLLVEAGENTKTWKSNLKQLIFSRLRRPLLRNRRDSPLIFGSSRNSSKNLAKVDLIIHFPLFLLRTSNKTVPAAHTKICILGSSSFPFRRELPRRLPPGHSYLRSRSFCIKGKRIRRNRHFASYSIGSTRVGKLQVRV